jgi:hypothetical protein
MARKHVRSPLISAGVWPSIQRAVNAMLVAVVSELHKLLLQVGAVPKENVVEMFAMDCADYAF